MKCKKIVCTAVCLILTASVVVAQKKTETNVENEYMTTIEDIIVTELANSDSYDNKFLAVKQIEEILDTGKVSPGISAALISLAKEGSLNQTKQNGRVTNNYPDLRAKSCDLLAKVKNEESKTALVTVALNDTEPMVASAAIRSLGEIGINKNDEVTKTIAWTQKRTAVLNPSSSLAYEVIAAYEKLIDITEDKTLIIESLTSIAANNRYVTPVRTKALELLKSLQAANASNQ